MGKPKYDLEERTEKFARQVIQLINSSPNKITNYKIADQLTRSAGSVGANFIESGEAISKKDFFYRIKICRKESKESRYWLRLYGVERNQEKTRVKLIQEATELMKIFGSIVSNSSQP